MSCRPSPTSFSLFFNDTAPTEIYTLSLHDALPILSRASGRTRPAGDRYPPNRWRCCSMTGAIRARHRAGPGPPPGERDRPPGRVLRHGLPGGGRSLRWSVRRRDRRAREDLDVRVAGEPQDVVGGSGRDGGRISDEGV